GIGRLPVTKRPRGRGGFSCAPRAKVRVPVKSGLKVTHKVTHARTALAWAGVRRGGIGKAKKNLEIERLTRPRSAGRYGMRWGGNLHLVPGRGLEPPRSYPLAPEASASTNSATRAGVRRRGNLRTGSGAVN